MYVGLKTLQHQFSALPNYLTNSDSIHCLTGWGKLYDSPGPYSSHLLYACEYRDSLKDFAFEPDMHLLCIVRENISLAELAGEFPENIDILFLQSADPYPVFQELQNYFNIHCGTGMFGQALLEFLAFEDGLQAATEYSYRAFRNPVFVFDANFNLISATWEAIRQLNLEDAITANKKFSEREFNMLNRRNHIHDKVRKSELPIRSYNEDLGYEQLLCAINTKKDLGHIVVSAVNKPFEDIDTEFLLLFKKYVDQQLKKDAFVRNSRGFHYEYFLKDLLDGKIVASHTLPSQMGYVTAEFSGNMYCLVVETARSPETVNPIHIRNLLESRFPNSRTLIYNGQIIAIISMPKNQLIPHEYIETGLHICREHILFAGMSNCFQDIMQFSEYYFQALRAIELGIGTCDGPSLFVYKDYYLEHIKHIFLQKESADTFCHPKMKFLLDYDREHRSQLAYTLYMYLIHERNLASASAAMEMHRTSLVYRFKKIYALIGDDFEDDRERLYLILSYELNT